MTEEQKKQYVERSNPAPKPGREEIELHAAVLSGLTPATVMMTREGEVPVEWLAVGDEVLTRDKGFVPIAWINRIRLSRNELRDVPEYAPVTLSESRIEPGFPSRDVVVSPRQLVMVRSPLAERDYWSSEVLVPAAALGAQRDPETMHHSERATYTQILLPTHELMMTEASWVGSLFTGMLAQNLGTLSCDLTSKLDEPRMQASRPILSEEEGRALMIEIDTLRAEREDAEEHQEQSA